VSYIGVKPTIGNFQICDAISVVNGQAAYTMQVGSVNVIPQSANHMIVSLNGTIQKPNSSFTVSGAVITFSSNLVTNDVIDFIQILGDVLDLGVPSDSTCTTAKLADDAVTAAKLNNDIISGTTALASEPADTDEFLVSDAGTLKRIDYSLIKGGGITEADQFRLTSTITGANADISSNLERVDDATFGKIGTGMSESSGVFTFPSTGIYEVRFNGMITVANDANAQIEVNVSSNSGGAYDVVNNINVGNNNSSTIVVSTSGNTFVDVTDASTFRVKFVTTSFGGSTSLSGSTSSNYTYFTFIRLGDT
jgi:hypothetical protein